MSFSTKHPSTETDLFFGAVCFAICGALFFFLGQYLIYKVCLFDVPPTWLAVAAILGGLVAVPAGLFYQRALKLNCSRRMIGVWLVFGILCLAFIILAPTLSEYTFDLSIPAESSKHEEMALQGKIEYDDYIVHKIPAAQATWKIIFAPFETATQPVPIAIFFSGADGTVKSYSTTLVPGDLPKILDESADFKSVRISSEANSQFQLRVTQPLSFSGNRAIVTNFGQFAVILLPFMAISMLSIGIACQMLHTRCFVKRYSVLLKNKQTGNMGNEGGGGQYMSIAQ